MGKISEFLEEIKITEEDLPEKDMQREEPKREDSEDKFLKEIRLPEEGPKREGLLDKLLREIKQPDEDLLEELEELEEEPEDVGVKKSSIIAALLGVLAGMILSSFLFGWN